MRTICPHIFVRLVTCGLTCKTVLHFKDFESGKVELRAEGSFAMKIQPVSNTGTP